MQFSIEKTEIQQKKVRSYRKKVRLPVVLLQETERSPAIRHLHQFEIWDDGVGKYSLFQKGKGRYIIDKCRCAGNDVYGCSCPKWSGSKFWDFCHSLPEKGTHIGRKCANGSFQITFRWNAVISTASMGLADSDTRRSGRWDFLAGLKEKKKFAMKFV